MRKYLYAVVAGLFAVAAISSLTGAATNTPLATPVCLKTDGVSASVIDCPTTTLATTTTVPSTTTATTTTTQPAGGFMSYPLAACTTSINGGTNVVISNRSYRGCRNVSAIVVSGAQNVTIHDVDFDSNSGDILLSNVTGTVSIYNIRARNTGAGRTTNGSGQGEVIQLAQTNVSCDISNVKSYGGNTEDQISIFRSGGLDATHPCIIENNHIESPLPGSADGALAWSSGSGTCINVADGDGLTGAAGHDIVVRNNTLLNCGQAALMENRPLRVERYGNVIYGAQRTLSNVGITSWTSHSCSACTGNYDHDNRVWWVNASGGASDQHYTSYFATQTSNEHLHDATIDPVSLHVVL